MGRFYAVNFTPTALTASADLFELTPADDRPILIHGYRVWQTSDTGDAQEEVLTLNMVRGNTSSGTGGSAATPARKNRTDPTASFTAEVGNGTQASGGTTETPYSTGWNVRAPLEVVFTPEQRVRCDQGDTMIVLRLGSAPADSLTIGCSVDVEEL